MLGHLFPLYTVQVAINRSRTIATPFVSPGTTLYEGRLSYADNWYTLGTFLRPSAPYSYASINDEAGKFVKGVVRPCAHTTVDTECHPVSLPVPTVAEYNYFRVHRCGPVGFSWSDPSGMVSYPSYGTDGTRFIDSVMRSTTEVIPTQLSVPNFLLELDDIPRSLEAIGKLSRYGPKTLTGLRQAVSTRKVNLGKTAADHWLAWNFGIMPTISDLSSFVTSHAAVSKRIRHLKRTNRQSTPFRKTKSFTSNGESSWSTFDSYPFGSIQSKGVGVQTYTVSTGGYVYRDIPDLDNLDKDWRTYAAAYGFNRPLSVLWEAIPFSFLADYVSNIGDLAQKYTVPLFNAQVSVAGGWTTAKTVTKTSVLVRCSLPSGGYDGEQVACSSVKTEFSRGVGCATSQGIKFDTSQTWQQALNTLALFA